MFGKEVGPDPEAWPPVDLGSQLEDLFVHVLKCEGWANLDDRIDLSLGIWLRPGRDRQDGLADLDPEAGR
jgi:hypothetical protein